MTLPDTLIDAVQAVKTRKISSTELVQGVVDRILQNEPKLHAYNSVFAESALNKAKAFDQNPTSGPLAGVPIAIKDNICTTEGLTTCSSKMLANFKAPYNATVIEKLNAAGAIMIGKTNLDEFAMGSSTENSAFGPTFNPWDTTRIPGGSSGGSASALAASMCCGAIGSDTGGSIRQPASLCGIVGLKPTYGRVSRYGLVAYGSSLDQIGPFGHCCADAALMMNVLAGHDPLDSTSAPNAVPDHLADLDKPLSGLRLGIVKEYSNAQGLDPEVKSSIDKALEVYKSLGATLVEVSLPNTQYAISAYYIIAPCEASSNLARYDGVHYGHRTKEQAKDIVELFSKSRAEGFGDEVQRRIMIGAYALSSGYYDAYYLRAQKIRSLIVEDFKKAFTQCDAIVCPTSPIPAFKVGEKSGGDPVQMYLIDIFTVTANIAAIPGLSIPCGFTAGQKPLPIGLQLMGPVFSEPTLLRIGRMYEKATDWHTRRPNL